MVISYYVILAIYLCIYLIMLVSRSNLGKLQYTMGQIFLNTNRFSTIDKRGRFDGYNRDYLAYIE